MDTTSIFRVDGMVAVVTGRATGTCSIPEATNRADAVHLGTGFMMAKALAGAGAKRVYILGRRRRH
ncbi:hypothetical protein LZ30DRAFT_253078 [Colletotrichum cereale]|nr:hypothetical protein LZ30DRAFT_253078 [Colletotrichum cereale]